MGIFISSFLLSAAIIGILFWSRLAWRIATDIPNGRSLHREPIPRVGGWGVVPGALITAFVFGTPAWLLAAIALTLFLISYVDDCKGLPIGIRMPIHAAAAALWLSYGPIDLQLLTALLAGCGIVWITNLFNFMDGADGLAGGMALFAFATFAAVAAAAGITPLAVWSMALAGAAAGFLLFNFNPARVFLGDAGSVTLGFLAGTFGIWGWAAGAWPFWFPFLVASPFFIDATVTLFRRVLRREAFWMAHREHYYQRLIRSGWSHRRTAFFEYALMASCSLLAIAMLDWPEPLQYAALGAAGTVYAVIAYVIDRRWAAFQRQASDDTEALADDAAAELARIPFPSTDLMPAAAEVALVGSRPRRGGVASRGRGLRESAPQCFEEPAFQEAEINRR